MNKKLIAMISAIVLLFSLGSASIASAHGKKGMMGKAYGIHKVDHHPYHVAFTKVITDTLGISEEALRTRLKAGDSLALIAGGLRGALINAIVVFKTQEIDAALLAGKVTAQQASTMKVNLLNRVTDMVDATRGIGKGHGVKGLKGHGLGFRN